MGPEIYGAGQGGASGGSAAFDPVHVEIVDSGLVNIADGYNRLFITPKDRYARYQGPMGPLNNDYGYPEDFPLGTSPAIKLTELPDVFGTDDPSFSLGGFPSGLYYVEHTALINLSQEEREKTLFDVIRRKIIRIPASATSIDHVYPEYNDPWNCELSATEPGGDNGGNMYPEGSTGFLEYPDYEGYRMRMTGVVHLEEGDFIAVIANAAALLDSGRKLYFNRIVVRKIAEAVPRLQPDGDGFWAP